MLVHLNDKKSPELRVSLGACLCLFLTWAVAAQTDTLPANRNKPFLLGLQAHRGFILPHSKSIVDVAYSNPYGVELRGMWLRAEEEHTRNSGIVTQRGFLINYINFDNPEVLGYSVSAVALVEPLIRPRGRLYGSIQMGAGVTFLSKVYDEKSNPANLFFSTLLSFTGMVNAKLYFKINPQWEVSIGYNYNHISNGGMKLPNKGMNFPMANAGLQYRLRPTAIQRPLKTDDWKQQPRNYAYALGIGSIKTAQATPDFPVNEYTYLLGAWGVVGRQIGRLSGVSAGTEWVHDGWAREILNRQGINKSAWKGSMLLGYEVLAGRTRFGIHFGAYVFNPSGDVDPVYQRYSLLYRFGDHLMVGTSMKCHRHVADVIDVRLGWLW